MFKNCAPFTKCITKIDETTIDDAEDLDLVMPVSDGFRWVLKVLAHALPKLSAAKLFFAISINYYLGNICLKNVIVSLYP